MQLTPRSFKRLSNYLCKPDKPTEKKEKQRHFFFLQIVTVIPEHIITASYILTFTPIPF